jgi:glycosyltransferase involved in cell wall biosynthesis
VSAYRPLRIVVIAPLRFAIRRPHAGGLESAIWTEVDGLRRRGHDVRMIGVRGSDVVEPGSAFELPELHWPAGAERTDETYPPSLDTESVPALARALDRIAAEAHAIDVVANHCLHPLPLRRASALGVPMVTTLHTPVDPSFVEADAVGGHPGSVFHAVSAHTRREWAAAGIPSDLLPNGVDPAAWPLGPGGDDLVWFGRIVPEKAPHLAIEVARRLGRRIVLAGRIGDADYAERMLLPRLGEHARYIGELPPEPLAELVGRSAAALSTPAWAEPFGLVAPEALMTGTPAVSFAVGGVPEVAADTAGMRVVPPGDVAAMAEQVDALIRLSRESEGRARIRNAAIARFSHERRLDELERRFRALLADRDLLDATAS